MPKLLLYLSFVLFLCISCTTENKDKTSQLPTSTQEANQNIILEKKLVAYADEELLQRFPALNHVSVYDITYLSDNLKVKGFLITPKKEGNYPCVIFNRGGNREHGVFTNKIIPKTGLVELAHQGFVVIGSHYRGNAGGEGQEEFGGKDINDVLNLIPALEEIYTADTKNIGMYGWSRGGMMTYQALTKTNAIKAAAVGGALSDAFECIKDRPKMESRVFSELIPNYSQNRQEELEKRSAVYWVEKFPKNVPILLMHGNSDGKVKPSQSLKLASAFDTHRIPFRLIMFEGEDHIIRGKRKEVNQHVIDWFGRYLREDAPTPDMEYR
ncbi:alpha/beta hydrolase family protein [Aquimarina sediminis]|uniref:alpha/beta hydrolase family protein n=1 Tax=Aquimarina sediminis TaxID=2070536 RepID=UPI000CA040D5|nr:prolyl oligopeptidase family serine peptidase [Aquimarina sediminis]